MCHHVLASMEAFQLEVAATGDAMVSAEYRKSLGQNLLYKVKERSLSHRGPVS